MTGFFEEAPGVKSSMRLYAFIALCAAIILAGVVVLTKQINTSSVSLIGLFVGGALIPKSIQKFAEIKKTNEN